ncbi:sce7726 family protein [Sphingobacterium cellulitidis]|uniref:sce7726 family protein n=1 Tax=Sphingobacterium cellulitidis TaxID=1768011 RepID=UPI000B93E906|nr:hypothetical protein CHT99_15660 [Sphingobacterium cellulitidis]
MKDPEIRQVFKNIELKKYLNDSNCKVIDELDLSVAKARIDIAVLNGSMYGYEIKSASDTLNRLQSQVDAYSKIFDYLSIITEEKYIKKIQSTIPNWIGIYLCEEESNKCTIKRIRAPKKNKLKEGFYLAKLLWREELIDCLNIYNIPFNKKDRNWILCEIISNNLNIDTLSDYVRESIKLRSKWRYEIITTPQ